MTPKKFHHKPTEVFAVSFTDMKGTIDLQDFPIDIEVQYTGKTTLNALFGPLPVFEVKWIDVKGEKHCEKITHNTVIIARIREYHGAYRGVDEGKLYLDFMDYDEFYGIYEEVK